MVFNQSIYIAPPVITQRSKESPGGTSCCLLGISNPARVPNPRRAFKPFLLHSPLNNLDMAFVKDLKSFPRTFWIANSMELFERWAYYGMFTVLSVYLTDPVS